MGKSFNCHFDLLFKNMKLTSSSGKDFLTHFNLSFLFRILAIGGILLPYPVILSLAKSTQGFSKTENSYLSHC